jgi:hypothetical protein
MSNKRPVRQKSIRINMRFGVHSDVRLVRKLESLPPYARAKFLRQLIDYGLRRHQGEHMPNVPVTAPPQSAVPASESVTSSTLDSAFSESVSQLLGKTVR